MTQPGEHPLCEAGENEEPLQTGKSHQKFPPESQRPQTVVDNSHPNLVELWWPMSELDIVSLEKS